MTDRGVTVGCPICRRPALEMLPSTLYECLSCGAVISELELADLTDAEVEPFDDEG